MGVGPANGLAGTAATAPAAATSFSDVLSSAQSGQTAPAPPRGGVPSTGDMRSTATRRQFAVDLLGRMGMPETTENVRAVMAWQAAEGTRATFNPLATTQKSSGATDFNSVGVKNYTSYEQGLQATVTTLYNGRYEEILAALRDGSSAKRLADAVANSPWGTGDGVNRVLATS